LRVNVVVRRLHQSGDDAAARFKETAIHFDPTMKASRLATGKVYRRGHAGIQAAGIDAANDGGVQTFIEGEEAMVEPPAETLSSFGNYREKMSVKLYSSE
jgi:hypothetical protein